MNMVIMQHSVIGTIITISWYYHHSTFFVRDIRLKVCIGIVLLRFLAAHVVCGQTVLHLITHLSFEHQLRQTVQRFCQEKLGPYADEIDKKNEFPRMRVSS